MQLSEVLCILEEPRLGEIEHEKVRLGQALSQVLWLVEEKLHVKSSLCEPGQNEAIYLYLILSIRVIVGLYRYINHVLNLKPNVHLVLLLDLWS